MTAHTLMRRRHLGPGRPSDSISASQRSTWMLRPVGTLRGAFHGKNLEGSAAGSRAVPRSFGPLGFVGTSVWTDLARTRALSPALDTVVALKVYLPARVFRRPRYRARCSLLRYCGETEGGATVGAGARGVD